VSSAKFLHELIWCPFTLDHYGEETKLQYHSLLQAPWHIFLKY